MANCDVQQAQILYPGLAGSNAADFKKNCIKGQSQYKFNKVLNADQLSGNIKDGQNANLEHTVTASGVSNKIMVTLIWNEGSKQWYIFGITATTFNGLKPN